MYDFETLINRTGTGASKWEKMARENPNVAGDVVPMSVGDMDFITAPEIREGLKYFIDNGVLGYIHANDAYYHSVCSWMERHHNWNIDKDWIVTSPGVVPALYHAVHTFSEPGDSIIIMTPVYYPFFSAVEDSGRKLLLNELVNVNGRYEIDFDDLREKCRHAKLLLFCSPHNPVSRVWTKDELARIAGICIANNVLIFSDEIHFDFIFPGFKHTVLANIDDGIAQHCIIATAPSKTFNLAGLQTANIIIPNKHLRIKYSKGFNRNFSDWNLPVLGGKACELAYNKGGAWLKELLVKIEENKNIMESALADTKLKVTPMEGTYLQWIDFRAIEPDSKLLRKKLIAANLFTDEGNIFGKCEQGFARFNLACPTRYVKKAAENILKIM